MAERSWDAFKKDAQKFERKPDVKKGSPVSSFMKLGQLEKIVIVLGIVSAVTFVSNLVFLSMDSLSLHAINYAANFIFLLSVISVPLWAVFSILLHVKGRNGWSMYTLVVSVVMLALFIYIFNIVQYVLAYFVII